jgi:hypothetical protein
MPSEAIHYILEAVGGIFIFLLSIVTRSYDRRLNEVEESIRDTKFDLQKVKDDDRARWDAFWTRFDLKFNDFKKEILDLIQHDSRMR